MIKKKLILTILIISSLSILKGQEVISDTVKGTNVKQIDSRQKKSMKTVKLKDGSFYNGYILEDNPREILMDIEGLGKMYIPKFSIKSIESFDATKIEDGEIKQERLTNRNYMFNRSCLPFEENKLTIDMPNLLFGQLNYAINKNIRVGIFSSILALPVGVNVGLSYPISKELYVGGDLNWGGFFFLANDNNGYYAPNIFNVKAKLTSGTTEKHLTVVAGYSLLQYKENTSPSLLIPRLVKVQENGLGFAFCGAYKVSKNLSLIGEVSLQQIGNNANIILVDPAIRLHTGRRSSFVLGINTVIISDGSSGNNVPVIPLPHIGANFMIE